MELETKKFPQDFSSSLSNQITYLKGERDVIIKKQSELQIERDKIWACKSSQNSAKA